MILRMQVYGEHFVGYTRSLLTDSGHSLLPAASKYNMHEQAEYKRLVGKYLYGVSSGTTMLSGVNDDTRGAGLVLYATTPGDDTLLPGEQPGVTGKQNESGHISTHLCSSRAGSANDDKSNVAWPPS